MAKVIVWTYDAAVMLQPASCCMQLVNMERRMLVYNIPSASVPAARSFYRAAAELMQKTLDANASPNGEAAVGSQQYKNLMAAMKSFIRIMSSWAQLEFTHRCACFCQVHAHHVSQLLCFQVVGLCWVNHPYVFL